MSPRVRGTLDGQDRADTCTFWRRPGVYRYELEVRGKGGAEFCLEALGPGQVGSPDPGTGWETIEEWSSVPSGSRLAGVVAIPKNPLENRPGADWIQLRLRVSRTSPNQLVQYEFYLEPGEPAEVR